MISATAWIAKGRAARHPTKYAVDDAELERVAKLANVQYEDAKIQLERAQKQIANAGADGQGDDDEDEEWDDEEENEDEEIDDERVSKQDGMDQDDDPDGLKKYNLDDYDNEAQATTRSGPFRNVKGLQYYRNNDEDPYITLKDGEEEDSEEREDLEVQEQENLIVCAKTEDEVSLLEAYLYNPTDANLYVHHDLMLPSFPLCLEWLDFRPSSDNAGADSSRGNFIAVGTMDPEIEIWSMDVVDGLYPDAILGQRMTEPQEKAGTGKKKRRQLKQRTANAEYHVDAVLGLSWNRVARNLLASASADATVKLWDLGSPDGGSGKIALRSFNDLHSDKVQSVAWDTSNSAHGAIAQPARLLSGSYDKTIAIFDSRSPSDVVRATIAADVEAVRWNAWREHNFFVALENGLVQSYDARMPNSAAFTLSAHDGACTSIDVSPHIPGCLLTGGTDKLVKLWNVEQETSAAVESDNNNKVSSISLVASRNLDAGKIFTAQFSPDDALTLVAAGSQGSVRIWDALTNVGVRKTFGQRLRQASQAWQAQLDASESSRGDGVIRLADEDQNDDERDDGEDVDMQA